MLCGAAAGLAVLLTAYFFPLPEKWRLAAALTAAGGCASGLVGFIWPIREETAALAADQCGLKERAQTALMLRNEDSAMAELQRQDACQALQALDARKIPLPRSKKLLSAFGALMLLMGGVSLLPDPQAQALARIEQFNKRMEEALQLAAAGLKKKMAEDADGAGIADGPFRAWNLTNLSSAISQQAETHALLNKRQEEKKETGGVMIELDKESEALAE